MKIFGKICFCAIIAAALLTVPLWPVVVCRLVAGAFVCVLASAIFEEADK